MSNELTNGPALWKEILSFFPEGSIIAGGCVRDYWLGKKPKDIDVFFPYTKLEDFNYWDSYQNLLKRIRVPIFSEIHQREIMREEYDPNWVWQINKDYPSDAFLENGYEDPGPINHVDDLIYKGNWQVNTIGLQDGIDALSYFYEFDLGTCMALFDGNLFYTKQFIDDMTAKTVTLVKPKKRTRDRAERFVNNNPEFTIVESTDTGTESS